MGDRVAELKADLAGRGSAEKAAASRRFFKCAPGDYGHGDVFLGASAGETRAVARRFRDLSLPEIGRLLSDELHEVRLCGLFILVDRFERGDEPERAEIAAFYLAHLDGVNNWDLVDSSAAKILGAWLIGRDDSILDRLAASGDLWRQRVAMIATQAFIRAGDTAPALRIAAALLHHPHDLIHKAVGWMLREAGKTDRRALAGFLRRHATTMPRTALRYAIEKLPRDERQRWMKLKSGI